MQKTVWMVCWLACFSKLKVQETGILSANSLEELDFFTLALRKIFPTVKGPKGGKKKTRFFNDDWEQGVSLVGMELGS